MTNTPRKWINLLWVLWSTRSWPWQRQASLQEQHMQHWCQQRWPSLSTICTSFCCSIACAFWPNKRPISTYHDNEGILKGSEVALSAYLYHLEDKWDTEACLWFLAFPININTHFLMFLMMAWAWRILSCCTSMFGGRWWEHMPLAPRNRNVHAWNLSPISPGQWLQLQLHHVRQDSCWTFPLGCD